MKTKILQTGIFIVLVPSILLLFVSNIFSQSNWEGEITTPISAPSSFGPYNYSYDICADNFGLHFVGLWGFLPPLYYGTLRYYFLDNNGAILDQILDLGNNGANITAVAACTYHGKVYVALNKVIGSTNKIRLYEKANTHPITSVWTYKDEYDAPATNRPYPLTIDMAADDYGLHIVWCNGEPLVSSASQVFYLNYRLDLNRWAAFGRIEVAFGFGPTLATSFISGTERVHVAYNNPFPYTKDYRFDNRDQVTLESSNYSN